MSNTIYEGHVVFWNRGRGFGFIQSGIREIFFHFKNFEQGYTPILGYKVQFELGAGLPNKPPQAVRVWYPKTGDANEKISALKNATSLGGAK